jgi:hypothetical protein
MNLLKRRVAATIERLQQMRNAHKAAAKVQRQQIRQTRADRERKVTLVGEAVLRRVERVEWDAADFYRMMDEALSCPSDRALFELDGENG